jgi:hypothetical protein
MRFLRGLQVLALYFWRRLGQLWRGSRWGYCLRCAVPWGGWGKGERHETWFGKKLIGTKAVFGIFPLCEPCWQELGTPKRRLPFYRRLQRKWVKVGAASDLTQWSAIERAVYEEANAETQEK